MRKQTFEENEYLVMAMFEEQSREQTIRHIEEAVPFVKDDSEMYPLVIGTIEKMKRMTDHEFAMLDLEPYKQEPEDGE